MKFQRSNRDPKLWWPTRRTLSVVLLIALFALVFLVACRSNREDQGHPYTLNGPALAEFTSLEPIDAHTHISQSGPAFVGMLESLHVHVLDILYVDDTDPSRSSLESQKQDALKFIASSKGHAQLCTTFDPFRFNDANFSEQAIASLNQDFANGAVAAKIWKNIGMELRNASGQYVRPDDPRLEPIYKDIAAHHKTLIAHLAEPDAAWESQDSKSPNAQYYVDHPQWDMSRKLGAPQKKSILQARDHLLAMNPDLRVVGAHLGSMEDDLDGLANRFDLYPNFAVDTAARVLNLAIQPRDKVQAFLLKYQDRILYGTDLRFESAANDQVAANAWDSKYALDWRYFATHDSFDYKGHQVEGLNLPRSVLQKLYHDNAVRWIPGIDATSH
jgi:predicted TIM-barrel fold metal-dependent hydrolase